MRYARTFQEAYRGTLLAIRNEGRAVDGVSDPTSVGSRFGKAIRPTRELIGDSFCVLDPRNRLLALKSRSASPAFLSANTVWTIGGGHDVDMISSYNPHGRTFARDESYFEASFGIRLFASGHQLRHVERRLRSDRASRRATAVIYTSEDTVVDRLDVPCALTLQFLIRDEKLQCLALMRSQSAALVMPYDVFLFTMIQELLAVRLGVELGQYLHFAASMHYYDEESELVAAVLDDATPPPTPMPQISDASDQMLQELIQAEQYARHCRRKKSGSESVVLDGFALDPYWREFIAPLVSNATSGIHNTWWAQCPGNSK